MHDGLLYILISRSIEFARRRDIQNPTAVKTAINDWFRPEHELVSHFFVDTNGYDSMTADIAALLPSTSSSEALQGNQGLGWGTSLDTSASWLFTPLMHAAHDLQQQRSPRLFLA
eukprot:g13819.t1